MKKIAIIGAGKMGSAFCHGLKKLNDFQCMVSDRHMEKLADLPVAKASANPNDILPDAHIVIVAVKPQSFDALMNEIKVSLADKVIVSIMAGITIASLEKKTGSSNVVRALPNLAASLGLSVTPWMTSSAFNDEWRSDVQRIFSGIGMEMELHDESQFDAAILPGCGPAFFFHLVGLMEKKAEALGFSSAEAMQIARQIFLGSATVFAKSEMSPDEWVKAVASKGGATEAGLKVLADKHFDKIFFEAIDAAVKRSRDLGK
jgi:pyrroline-5-carboxylate reductase